MSRALFALRADKRKFGDEVIVSLTRVLNRPHDEVAKLMSFGQYSIPSKANSEWEGVLVEMPKGTDCILISPCGEPGWTTMFQFCCEYATSNQTPMVMFNEDYDFCVDVDVGSTPESVMKLIDVDPFCGEETLK